MNNFKVVTFQDDEKKLEVIVSEDTKEYWFTIDQLCLLFSKSKKTIYRYIAITYDKYPDDKCHRCVILTHELSELAKKRAKCYSLEFVIKLAEELGSNQVNKAKNLLEDYKTNNNNFNDCIVYNNGTVSLTIKISPEEDTVWLNQSQISDLFESSRPNVAMHIQNIFNDNELLCDSVCKDFLHTAQDGKQYVVTFYNLDLILAVGYRIRSKRAGEFRKWASNVLKQYLLKGYALDEKRIPISTENIIRLENDVNKIKEEVSQLKEKVEGPNEIIFENGQYYDAYEYICKLFSLAKNKITIIDPYFDRRALNLLKRVDVSIKKRIYMTNPNALTLEEVEAFRKQYGPTTICKVRKFHDRFVIIDDALCYAVGTSLNYLGNKTFSICKFETPLILESLLRKLSGCQVIY